MEKPNKLTVLFVFLMMCFAALSLIHLCAMGIYLLMVLLIILYAIILMWLAYFSYRRVTQNKDSRIFIACVALYVLVSTILLGLVVSFTFRYDVAPINPDLSQTALGGVSEDSIIIWVRDASTSSFIVEYKEVGQGAWTQSPSTDLGTGSDFTGTIRLSGLQPATTYDYRTLRQDNTVVTQGIFRTLGKPVFTFAWGSCLMVGRTFSRKLAGLTQLRELSPDFYFLIGDNIYADIPWLNKGLGETVDRYRSSYRETVGTEDFVQLRSSIPGFHQLDDHEFINNYDEPNTTEMYKAGRRAFYEYLGSLNPATDPAEYFFNFNSGNTTFFVFDTRAHRPTHIIGPAQMAAVQAWLKNAQQAGFIFKFLISPQSVTQNFEASTEGWVSYPQEREALLDFIEQNNITGCIFLSGDLHQVGVYELRPKLFEISASPVDGSGQIKDHSPLEVDRELFKSYLHNIGFGVVHVNEQASPPVVTIRTYQSGGNVVMEMCRAIAGVVVVTLFLITMQFYYPDLERRISKRPTDDVMLGEGSNTAAVPAKRWFLRTGPLLLAFTLTCFIIFFALVVSPDTKTQFAIEIDANNNYRIL